ncbi:MAG: extracellular solute-binding protein, partial [Caldilineaceae bacterium]|nr:extracellular solute-binding protein [Caldilineaceae bacterium]
MMTPLSRRNFLKATGVAGVGALLAACAAPAAAPAGDSVEEGSPAQTATELRVLVAKGAPVEPVNEFLSEATIAKHPDVTTKFEYISGDLRELVYAQAAAGTLADVFFTADLFAVPFAKNNVSVDLKPFAEGDA